MLSPVLFIVVVDWIMRRVIEDDDGINLTYVDDIALLSKDISNMNRMTNQIERETGKVGLEVNKRKTKVMVVQPREDVRKELAGEVIDEVDWFEYLGSVV